MGLVYLNSNFQKYNCNILLERNMMQVKIKKPTYKELGVYLGVTEQAVKQYTKDKRFLMIQGLWKIKIDEVAEDKNNITK